MINKNNYYLNDYFDLFNQSNTKEKEYMKTNIYELNNKYIIETDLPGIPKEQIKINYENGYLTIKALKKTLNNNTYIRKEKYEGELKRSFYIGLKKEEEILATYENGVLKIIFNKEDIPKKESKNIIVS
jgi:HSP20 family protein